jgi:hypothetical protein
MQEVCETPISTNKWRTVVSSCNLSYIAGVYRTIMVWGSPQLNKAKTKQKKDCKHLSHCRGSEFILSYCQIKKKKHTQNNVWPNICWAPHSTVKLTQKLTVSMPKLSEEIYRFSTINFKILRKSFKMATETEPQTLWAPEPGTLWRCWKHTWLR